MKKVVCWVLCMVLMSSVGVALAETDDEKGIQAIWAMLDGVFGEGGIEDMIDTETFSVGLNDEGIIVISADLSVLMGVFGSGTPYAAEMISRVWYMFAASSRQYTETDVYMFLNYQGELRYFVTPVGVLDAVSELGYEHVKQQ